MISDFHAHIYFDVSEVDHARQFAEAIRTRFGVAPGAFHLRPVGPHPRGSVQLTVPVEQFGSLAQWLAVNRDGLTDFAYASTGDDRRDHEHNVVWFGPSEPLDLTIFD